MPTLKKNTPYSDCVLLDSIDALQTTLEKIERIEDEYALLAYARTLLPDWIVHHCDHYASEYQVLEQNWMRLCAQWNVTPRQILVVRHLPQTQEEVNDHQLMFLFCNRLTRMGYVIRHQRDLVPCQVCKGILLSQEIYNVFKQRQSTGIPAAWSPLCSACQTTQP
jgi:hypothetical protein